MNISENGIKLIKNYEGCKLKAYKPVPTETYYTIGWGHYGADVKEDMKITQQEADEMFLKDIQRYVNYVNNPSYVGNMQLNQNQFDALVSFCYNCGNGNLQELCYKKTKEQISEDLLLYNKGGGKVLTGLVRRRNEEKQLFDKVVESMEDYSAKIVELEEVVKKIIVGLTQVSDKLAELPAPDWFVKEFPDALSLINQNTGTNDFWRAFAVCLRIFENQK